MQQDIQSRQPVPFGRALLCFGAEHNTSQSSVLGCLLVHRGGHPLPQMQGTERSTGQGAGWDHASLYPPKRGAGKAASPRHHWEGRKELWRRAGQEGTFMGCSEPPAEEGRGSTLANQPLLICCSWCRVPIGPQGFVSACLLCKGPPRKQKPFLVQNVPQAAAELGFQPQNGCCENRYRVSLCSSVPASAIRGLIGACGQTQLQFWLWP